VPDDGDFSLLGSRAKYIIGVFVVFELKIEVPNNLVGSFHFLLVRLDFEIFEGLHIDKFLYLG
jgi:hypothetical protein